MELAYELNLPVIIHCRDAQMKCLELSWPFQKINALKEYFIVGQKSKWDETNLILAFISVYGIEFFQKLIQYMSVQK